MALNRVAHIHYRTITRPLKVFFATSLGGKGAMRSLIVKVTLEDGSSGLGECPTSAAFPHETIPLMIARLDEWTRELKGTPITDWTGRVQSLRSKNPAFPMTVSGLETALFRAFLENGGIKESSYWGGKSKVIETDITIPFIPGHPSLPGWVEYGLRKGFKVFKVKVSGRLEEDKLFLSALFNHLMTRARDFTVRLDGNQGYTARTFLQMADYLEKSGVAIELFEQPLPGNDYKGLKEIRKRSPAPIILDETVVTAGQLTRAIDEGIGDGVNIKVAKSGILESFTILSLAREAGLKLMIGCMTETMVGLSAGICLAAGSAAFDYVDLDGVYFLRHRNRWGTIDIRPPRFFIGD
jgi:L-Ala-D/L-Glu epimerase